MLTDLYIQFESCRPGHHRQWRRPKSAGWRVR